MTEVENNIHKEEYKSSRLILLQDCVLSMTTSLLAIMLIRWLSEPIPGFTNYVLIWLGAALIGSLAGSFISGSHKLVRRWVRFRSSVKLVKTLVIKEAVMTAVLLTGFIKMPSIESYMLIILTDLVLTAVLLFYIRFLAIMFTNESIVRIKQDVSKMNTLVVGTDKEAVAMAEEILKSDTHNLIGFLSRNKEMSGRVIDDIIVYYSGNDDDFKALDWRLGGIDCLVFPKREISDNFSNQSGKDTKIENINYSTSKVEQAVKRAFDCSLSAILLVIFSPLALVSAIAIKLDDGKDVLYKQERIGKNGKPFNIIKFRTMRMDAEAAGAQLYSGESDPRMTRSGKFLRKYHLDELPQLWNVFRGDMSFVGYRPERQVFIDKIMQHNPRYRYLYQIRPGVTSYATLYNGYTDTMAKMLTRLDLDLYYLRNHSILFDMKILASTFLNIVSGNKF